MGLFNLFKRVLFLIFYPEKLAELSVKKTPDAPIQQFRASVHLVRTNVLRAMRITLIIAGLSVFTFLPFKILHISLSHTILVVIRCLGYMFILCGVFSPTGWKIQTSGGETLPEIIDEEWHRLTYGTGLYLLLFSYLFEM